MGILIPLDSKQKSMGLLPGTNRLLCPASGSGWLWNFLSLVAKLKRCFHAGNFTPCLQFLSCTVIAFSWGSHTCPAASLLVFWCSFSPSPGLGAFVMVLALYALGCHHPTYPVTCVPTMGSLKPCTPSLPGSGWMKDSHL